MTRAAIDGWCVGGGVALVAALDLCLPSAASHPQVPEVERGINMSWQSIPRLVSRIGAPRMRRPPLLGEPVAALPPMQVPMCQEGIGLAAGGVQGAPSAARRKQRDPFPAPRGGAETFGMHSGGMHTSPRPHIVRRLLRDAGRAGCSRHWP